MGACSSREERSRERREAGVKTLRHATLLNVVVVVVVEEEEECGGWSEYSFLAEIAGLRLEQEGQAAHHHASPFLNLLD